MRNLIAVLSLVSISLTALAKEKCVTYDLIAEQEKLKNTEGITSETLPFLIQGTYNVKMVQLLTCIGMNKKISQADSAFGVAYLEDDLKTRLHKLEQDRTNYENLLKDPEINGIEREIYSRGLAMIPLQIEQEKRAKESILKGLKRLTRDF